MPAASRGSRGSANREHSISGGTTPNTTQPQDQAGAVSSFNNNLVDTYTSGQASALTLKSDTNSLSVTGNLIDVSGTADDRNFSFSLSEAQAAEVESWESFGSDFTIDLPAGTFKDEFGNVKNSKLIEFANSRYPEIMGSDRIVITPHVGGMTWEGQTKAYKWAVDKFGEING